MTNDQFPSQPSGGSGSFASDTERLHFAMKVSGIGIWEVQPDTNTVIWDERCRELFGLAANTPLRYEQVIQCIHPEDVEPVKTAVQDALAGRNGGRYDIYYRTIGADDGKLRWVRFSGQAFFDNTGKIIRFGGIAQDISDLMNTLQQTGELAKLAEAALEDAGVGSFRFYLATHELEYSPSFARICTGNKHAGLPMEEFSRRVVPDDRSVYEEAYRDAAHTGQLHCEVRMAWDDGSVHWVQTSGKYLNDPNGRPYLFTGTVREVIERQRSEEQLRSIIAAAPAGICIFMGRDLVFRHTNQTLIDMVGKGPGIEGKPLREAMPELVTEDQPFLQILDDVFTTGKPFQTFGSQVKVEKQGVMTNNYYNFTYTPLFDEKGQVYGILEIVIDVTDLALAIQRAEKAEAGLRSAIELAALGTWTLDARSGVISFSDRIRQWFGFSSHQANKQTVYEQIHPKDRERVIGAMEQAIHPGSNGLFDEEYTILASGTAAGRILHAQGKAVFDDHQAISMAGTIQDVTIYRQLQLVLESEVLQRTEELAVRNEDLRVINNELAHTNQLLTRSNEELAQYAYVASHDLQEPLRKIRMFAGLLENESSLQEKPLSLVRKINQSSERMAMLIRDLLEFSRLLRSDSMARPVNLQEVVANVTNDFELLIEEKGAVVHIGKLPEVEAIALQMNQLFYNLLSNALKFSKAGVAPLIRLDSEPVSLEEAGKYIVKPAPFAQYYHITLKDNGIGFETRFAEHIFEVFKRLHTREIYPGSGIGLAMCRRIADNHCGHLSAESAPGEGSVFHLFLPDKQHHP